jgi:hypothetical protein
MDETRPTRRSYLRFGVRDLLWVMVVVGLALGWWLGRREPRQAPVEIGRYQMLTDKDGLLQVMDTATGVYWTRDSYSHRWHQRAAPKDNLAN